MNVIAQIVQCPNCLRYVCGGAVLALSFGESAAAAWELCTSPRIETSETRRGLSRK